MKGKRLIASLCALVMMLQAGITAGAVESMPVVELDELDHLQGFTAASVGFADTEHTTAALSQGDYNGDVVTQTDLNTSDMVHNNPGLLPWDSAYNDPQFLKDRGYNDQVLFLYDAGQYGCTWDKFDEDFNLTGADKVFPEGSEARAWVTNKASEITEKYNQIVDTGLGVYFMMDIIVLPTHLRELAKAGKILHEDGTPFDIETGGKIDVSKADTQILMDYMFAEMFEKFPQIDGIYFRYGENYSGPTYGSAPYHSGNNPAQGPTMNQNDLHEFLINYLRTKLYLEPRAAGGKERDLIYRTWGFGSFATDAATYRSITDRIEPDEHLYFCIKHAAGDFHRLIAFSQLLGTGKHQQIVEVQAAREYEGKGAHPNYIGDSVINGFEEFEWLMSEDQKQNLRDIINCEDSLVKGIWTWSRGGGWNGPYINGENGDAKDFGTPSQAQIDSNPYVKIEDGSEMWADLNAYVVTHWAKDTSKTDKYYVKQYAREILGMTNEKDIENFYRLCILSSRAVLLGRATDDKTVKKGFNVWWIRDNVMKTGTLNSNVSNANKNGVLDVLLAERAESVALWKEMIGIAEGFSDQVANLPLYDSPNVNVKDYIITTCKYGYYLFGVIEQAHRVSALKLQTKDGLYPAELKEAIDIYDALWEGWQELYETAPGCPSPYMKDSKTYDLRGYSGYTGFDAAVKDMRYVLQMPESVTVAPNATARLSITSSPYKNNDYSKFVFTSNKPEIVTVDTQGNVTGVAEGSALVTTAFADGTLSAVTVVTVDENASMVDPVEGELVYKGDFEDLAAYVVDQFPSDFTPRNPNVNTTGLTVRKDESSGNQYMEVIQTAKPSASQWYIKKFDDPFAGGKYKVSVDITTSNNAAYFFLMGKDDGKVIAQIDFRDTGKDIALNFGGNNIPVIHSETDNYYNKDYHFEFICDVTTRKFMVSVNGSTPAEYGFREAATEIGGYRIGTASSGNLKYPVTIKFDNVFIYKVEDEEPEVPKTGAVAVAAAVDGSELTVDLDTENAVKLPTLPEGFDMEIQSSEPTGIVNADGSINMDAVKDETDVTFTVKVKRIENEADSAEAKIKVIVKPETEASTIQPEWVDEIEKYAVKLPAYPEVPAGFSIALKGSDHEDIVALDGSVSPADEDTDVTLTFEIVKDNNPSNRAEVSYTVTIIGTTADEVLEDSDIRPIKSNDTEIYFTDIPEGFEAEIIESSDENVITVDGEILPTDETTEVLLTVQVTKLSNGTTAQKTIVVTVPVWKPVNVFENDFERYDVDDDLTEVWKPSHEEAPKNTLKVVEMTGSTDDSKQALKLTQPDTIKSTCFYAQELDEALTGQVLVSLDMMLPEDSAANAFFVVSDSNDKIIAQLDLNRQNGNDIALNVSGTIVLQKNLERNRWYRFDLILDTDNQIYSVKIDGKLVRENQEFRNEAENIQILKVASQAATVGTAYYDNITAGVIETTPLAIKAPTATPKPDTYYGSQAISLVCATTKTMIYYTVDGSDPEENGVEYTEPFEITESTTIKAIAIRDDLKSKVAEFKYVIRPVVIAESIVLDRTGISLKVGESDTLKATILPTNVTDKTINWSSNKTDVVTVDTKGRITAVGVGSALVTAATDNGKEASCLIMVSKKNVNSSSSSGFSSSSSSSNTNKVTVEDADNGTVETDTSKAAKGDTITITVKPDTGYEVDEVIVTDKNGDEIRVTDKGNNKFTFKMPDSKVEIEVAFKPVSVPTPPAFISYSDVTNSDWFASAVSYVSANGIMNGNRGSFSPNTDLNRGMIAQILYNMEGGVGSFALAYPDVSSSDWYANAVSWVSAHGVMRGYGSGLFGANDSVTREQLALTLYQYARVKGYDLSGSVELTAFVDGHLTSDWARPAMQWAVANGLISGKSGSKLDPQGTATRAEVAAVLMNFAENIAK